MHKMKAPEGYSLFLPISAYLARKKTAALLPDGKSHDVPCQREFHAQVRVLCVHGEKPHCMQNMIMCKV